MISMTRRIRSRERIEPVLGNLHYSPDAFKEGAYMLAFALREPLVETQCCQSARNAAHRTRHRSHPPRRRPKPSAQLSKGNTCSQTHADLGRASSTSFNLIQDS